MITVALADGVALTGADHGSIEVELRHRRNRLSGLDEYTCTALLSLSRSGRASWEDLAAPGSGSSPPDHRLLTLAIKRLAERGYASLHCVVDGEELLSAEVCSALAVLDFSAEPAAGRMMLSRFACLRRCGPDLVVEAALAFTRIRILAPPAAQLLPLLSQGCTLKEAVEALPDWDPDKIEQCLRFFLCCGAIAVTGPDGTLPEDEIPELRQREFHDVLLHTHSRSGLTRERLGGTYRFLGAIAPTPAFRRSWSDRRIALPEPDLENLARKDLPLTQVMETRRSIRVYGDEPITGEQLGEFLYRVARSRAIRPAASGRPYETTNRPYPSGGATYDLELYLAIRACRGLAPGLYHYEPDRHALAQVCEDGSLVTHMLATARRSSGAPFPPHVLIVLASRFSRLSWKYQGIAYATVLKNVGVLYEAMYLAATAMGLAPCALGGGDSAAFAKATGLHPMAESSVGEFMLGTRRE
jgi:SagB-type dehydrogenase family enzyme